MRCSVVIPAHNEEAVVARGLRAMLDGAQEGELDIVVVCNGCTDGTAQRAREVGGPIRVIDTPTAGKTHALNLGDDAAGGVFPRFYVDADLILTIDAMRQVEAALREPGVLAAAPRFDFDLSRSSALVRSYYRAWRTMPYFDTGRIAGAYALTREGRERFDEWPDVISDDGFVRLQFAPHERRTVEECGVTVVAPGTLRDLLSIKTRSRAGTMELKQRFPHLFRNETASESASLRRMLARPLGWPDAWLYTMVTLESKRRAVRRLRDRETGKARVWERDESSRVVETAGAGGAE